MPPEQLADRPLNELQAAELIDAIRSLKRGTALVVGDAMLDRYVYGNVNRVSPEAPVPTGPPEQVRAFGVAVQLDA